MRRPPLLVIAGPTATGKTGLSIAIAEALRADGVAAEIVSADSRQVYRGLDIGTAKVSPAERARVPHHGLDLADPDEPVTVADFARHAGQALEAIAGRGGLAILAGGTGLYLRAVARGIAFDALPADPQVRAAVDALVGAPDGLAAAVAELERRAPGLAAATDLRNPRRVARALEIARLAGDAERPALRAYPAPSAWLGLAVEPGLHREWISRRARAQFDEGLIEEARALRQRFDPALPAFSAIGYREAWAVLDGEIDRESAIALDAQRNVAFARRQRTWFRAEPGIAWHDAACGERTLLEAALDAARRLLEREPTRLPGAPAPVRGYPDPDA